MLKTARLAHTLCAALLCGLLLLPRTAQAGVSTVLKVVGYALTFTGSFLGPTLIFAGNAYGNVEVRRKIRRAAAAQRAAYNAGLQARTITGLTSEPPYRCGYGRCVVGGDVLAIFTTDKSGADEAGHPTVKPDGLRHLVIHFQSRQAAAIHEIYIEGVPVGELDGNGVPTGGAFGQRDGTASRQISFTGGTTTVGEPILEVLAAWKNAGISGEDKVDVAVTFSGATFTTAETGLVNVSYTVATTRASVRISKFLGSPDQPVDPYLHGLLPDKWTTNHRARGLAGIVITLDLEDSRFQGGPPNITAEGSWARVYDPRQDSTVPGGIGAQRHDQPGTWAWSDNPALCVADFLASEMGYGVDAREDIDVAHLIAAANACDESITLDDGEGPYIGKRYTCNGSFTSDASRESVLDELLGSMAGNAIPAGRWVINAGTWTLPAAELTETDLAGDIQVLQADTGTDDLINSARGRYVARGKAQPDDANPPYTNPVLVAADQGRALWGSFSYPYTDSPARVRNLLRIEVERRRAGQALQVPCQYTAFGLRVGQRVLLTSGAYGLVRKAYRITDREVANAAPVMLTLQEDAAEIWDDADAAIADPTPNTGLPDPYVVDRLQGLAATSGPGTLLLQADGTVVPQVVLAWDAIESAYVVPRGRVLIRWRRNDDITWRALPPVPGDATAAAFTGPLEDDRLVIEATVRNTLGQVSDPVFIAHTVLGKGGGPATPASFSATPTAGGLLLSWPDNPEADADLAVVRVGATWGSAAEIFRGRASPYLWPWPAPGTYTLQLRYTDTAGTESASRVITATVDPHVLVDTASNVNVTGVTGIPYGSITVVTTRSFTPAYSGEVLVTFSGEGDYLTDSSGTGLDYAGCRAGVRVNGTRVDDARFLDEFIGFNVNRRFPVSFARVVSVTGGTSYTIDFYAQRFAGTLVMRGEMQVQLRKL